MYFLENLDDDELRGKEKDAWGQLVFCENKKFSKQGKIFVM